MRLAHLVSSSPKLRWSIGHLARFFPLSCLLLVLCLLPACSGPRDTQTALEVASAIADKVIKGTTFEFEAVPQEVVLGVEVVDFRRLFGTAGPGVGYALSNVVSDHDTLVTFGVSARDGIKVFLNSSLAYRWDQPGTPELTEIAYDRFTFQDTFSVHLNAGANPILVKVATREHPWIFFLRPVTTDGDLEKSVAFAEASVTPGLAGSRWLCLGPFQAADGSSLPTVLDQVYTIEEDFLAGQLLTEHLSRYTWVAPGQSRLWKLTSDYPRWAYNDWHYSHGATMLSILALADATGYDRYRDFVRRYCDFIVKHYDYFQWQYTELHAFRGSFHRLYRRTMLDDTGAPALPFLQLSISDQTTTYENIVYPVADYIVNQQVRLENGTFCRPEPVPYTVWADDLFMSVPYLLRMGQLTGDPSYYDDAARQVLNFAELLFVEDAGLYKHGWFEPTGERSIAFWGRANGWVSWATAETLKHLPEDHPKYALILELFRRHMAGLARYQDPESGMWHQVLDHPQSYEETSCTSMFVLAMARGVRLGWLEDEYREIATRGWEAISGKVDADGTVHGICRGTGIGEDFQFYYDRSTFDHDPRGLGSMIIAGVEIDELMRQDASDNRSAD
ncbi:MAG: glycoside hydrolase family 88 protein [Fidelibacterota bacterium]|nr:MAG: glycoside hydrolase family 88 protein [Candidatus Neomarinimicrobiota bacterium]